MAKPPIAIWPYGDPFRSAEEMSCLVPATEADCIVGSWTYLSTFERLKALPNRPKVVLSIELGLVPHSIDYSDEDRAEESYRVWYARLANEMELLNQNIEVWDTYWSIDVRDEWLMHQYFYAMGLCLGRRSTRDLQVVDAVCVDTSCFTPPETRHLVGTPRENMDLFVRLAMRAFSDGVTDGAWESEQERIEVWVNSLGVDRRGNFESRSLQGLDSIGDGCKFETFGTPNLSDRYGSGLERIQNHLRMMLNFLYRGSYDPLDFEVSAKPTWDQRQAATYYAACAVIAEAYRLMGGCLYWSSDRYAGVGRRVDPKNFIRAKQVWDVDWDPNSIHRENAFIDPENPECLAIIRKGDQVRRVYWDEGTNELAVSDREQ